MIMRTLGTGRSLFRAWLGATVLLALGLLFVAVFGDLTGDQLTFVACLCGAGDLYVAGRCVKAYFRSMEGPSVHIHD
jgi:hypothetical protein